MMMLDASAEVDTQEQLELEKKQFALAPTKHFTFSKLKEKTLSVSARNLKNQEVPIS